MRWRCILTAIIGAAVAATGVSAKKVEYAYGPPPDWDRYIALATPVVLSKMPDPDNWAVEWPNGYMQGRWRHKGRFPGYLSCGVLRAKRPVEGRIVVNFVVVVDHDEVKTVDISQRMSNSLVNVMCENLTSRGLIPPARFMNTPSTLPVTRLGMTVRTVPEGAYVTGTNEGFPARRAGIMPGMMIAKVNGIALAGMGAAMVKLLNADTAEMAIDTATGERFTLKRAP